MCLWAVGTVVGIYMIRVEAYTLNYIALDLLSWRGQT